jgi:spermidine synthase
MDPFLRSQAGHTFLRSQHVPCRFIRNETTQQSRNWDGGKQEYNTALEALKRVFPVADVVENCVDKYPIRVTVSAQQHDETETTKIWSGRQQDLFSKYKAKRTKAMSTIEANLEEFKSKL